MDASDVIKEYEGFQIKWPITIKRGYNLKYLRRPCFPKTSFSRLVSLERARKDLFYWARSISHDLNEWLYRRKEFAFNTFRTNRELLEEHFKNYAFCDYFLKNIT